MPKIESIPGFPLYGASRDGRIWSKKNGRYGSSKRWRELKRTSSTSGHESISIRVGGKRSQQWAHRLVLLTFRGPCPDGMESRHKNGKPHDNRIANLKWSTRQENNGDRIKHGCVKFFGDGHYAAVLTSRRVAAARKRARSGASVIKLARSMNVKYTTLLSAVTGRTWKHVRTEPFNPPKDRWKNTRKNRRCSKSR